MFRPHFLLLLGIALAIWADAAVADGLSRLDEELVADAADGSLDQFDFLSACLIAGGEDDPVALAHHHDRLQSACNSIVDAALLQLPPEQRPRVVLEQLHARLLTGRYGRSASDLSRVLDSGEFNCLSALVLFDELCRRAGVSVVIVAQPGHVSAQTRDATMCIEPLSPNWSIAARPLSAGSLHRPISPAQLVGRFYYNRGLAQLAAGDYRAGIALSVAACRLDADDEDARANVLAGLQNWSATLSRQVSK